MSANASSHPTGLVGKCLGDSAVPPVPTAREINKRIRAEALLEKQNEKNGRKSNGAALGVLARVQRKHPGDPHAQISMFLREFVIYAGVGRRRPVSQKTSDDYRERLHQFIDELKEERAAIQNIGEIGRPHALKLVRRWNTRGQTGGTIQNKVTVLRRLLSFTGKADALPEGKAWRDLMNINGIDAPDRRKTVAIKSKAWDELDVDFEQVLQVVKADCPLTAIQLELHLAFGLRVKESISMSPKESDGGQVLRLLYGTKGGRPRDVPFDQDDEAIALWQRDVLERAKVLAMKHTKGRLARQGYSLEANKKHFYYRVAKAGVTKAALGVTPHGLRHQYAARRYKQTAGFAPPVSRDAPLHYTPEMSEADMKARMVVSHDTGHARYDVAGAYCGTVHTADKAIRRTLEEWVRMTDGNPTFHEACVQTEVEDIWLTGNFAEGRHVRQDERMDFTVRFKSGVSIPQVTQHLLERLKALYARGAKVTPWILEERPTPALEIFVRRPIGGV